MFLQDDAISVSIIILNWNNWQDTLRCLDCVDAIEDVQFQVIVCDNGSSDDSVLHISQSCFVKKHGLKLLTNRYDQLQYIEGGGTRPPLVLIENRANLGFAGGNNVGIRYALMFSPRIKWLWLLNNDTEVDAHALSPLLAAMAADENLGSVQSLLVNDLKRDLIDSAGIALRRRGGAVDLLKGKPLNSIAKDKDIFGCCAASALYRASCLRQVGLFDESFFAVNEDVDLAFRLRNAGFGARLIAESRVFHRRGISGKKKNRFLSFVARRNKLRLMARWWPRTRSLFWIALGLSRLLLYLPAPPRKGITEWAHLVREIVSEYRGGVSSETRGGYYKNWMN